jgi:arsenite methyltransferase
MQTSNAARLQHLALRIAARDGTGLDLTPQSNGKGPLGNEYLPDNTIQPGDRVVLIGAVDVNTLATVAGQCTATGSILAIESNDIASLQEQILQLEQDLGYRNWRFEETELDDLSTNPGMASNLLSSWTIQDLQDYREFQANLSQQRSDNPLVPSESADVVVLDWAVNRLSAARVKTLLEEAFRILRRGGKLVVLSLLADEPMSEPFPSILDRPDLRCIPVEAEIVTLLSEAGYYGMQYAKRSDLPLKVVAGIELRLFTMEAYKGKQGICLDRGHAVIYRGPWQAVFDDDGHRYVRGERVAVCEKTYEILNRIPYQNEFMTVPCYLEIPADQAPLFDCNTPTLRDPQVTKGKKTVFEQGDCCNSTASSGCC